MASISTTRVRAQLTRILASPQFLAAERISQLLSFLVEQSLNGQQHRIKQYTIAVEAFGYGSDFDPQTDSIIRMQARRLRRALGNYYETSGKSDPVHIAIPKGNYVPTFTENGATNLPMEAEAAERQEEPSANAEKAPGSISRPSIGVLPFAHQGDDEKAAYLANGITEELTVALSKYQGLMVIAHQSTIQFTNSSVGEVAKNLGVRFVLTGSVHKLEETIRVVAQLTDARDESVLWADTMRRDLSTAGLFDILDEITGRIVGIIGDEQGVILKRLAQETRSRSPQDLSVYEASLLYYHYHVGLGGAEHGPALEALERAVEKDPTYVLGWAHLAAMYADVYAWGYPGPANALDLALSCAGKAIALDPQSQEGHGHMASVLFHLHHHEDAIREAELAFAINPNNAFYVTLAGHFIGLSGELKRGCQIMEGIDERNPYLPGWLRISPYLYSLERGEFEGALHEARRFTLPDQPWEQVLRAAAAAHLGNESVAADAYRQLLKDSPEFITDPAPTIRMWIHFDRWVEAILEGLAKAGKF